MKEWLKHRYRKKLNNEFVRNEFVRQQLAMLAPGSLLLDAGCGSQQYKPFCSHLNYKSQDFGQYRQDVTEGFASYSRVKSDYKYGQIDYVGNIWMIEESDAYFDAILCTEVFEHIPFPTETIREFSRLMKPGGTLILTLPSNCLRHMDPYYFFSGFSNRYLEKFMDEYGFDIEYLAPIGDYYSWLATELARTMYRHSALSCLVLAPAFAWFFTRKKTSISINTLCMGYHVVAKRRRPLEIE